MKVVRHEASREQVEPYTLLSFGDQTDERGVIRRTMEQRAAIVATV
jgi:hypothetical protein